MTASAKRDSVAELAPQDPAGAASLARGIEEPYQRAQALGWVTRYSTQPREAVAVAREALDAASSCEDAYQQVASSAWPLRALMEIGLRDAALEMMELVMHAVPRVAPAASRAEALFLLYQAMFEADDQVRRGVLYALAELFDADRHWRVERAFRNALVMSRERDADFVESLVAGVEDDRRRALRRALAGGSAEPRQFYW